MRFILFSLKLFLLKIQIKYLVLKSNYFGVRLFLLKIQIRHLELKIQLKIQLRLFLLSRFTQLKSYLLVRLVFIVPAITTYLFWAYELKSLDPFELSLFLQQAGHLLTLVAGLGISTPFEVLVVVTLRYLRQWIPALLIILCTYLILFLSSLLGVWAGDKFHTHSEYITRFFKKLFGFLILPLGMTYHFWVYIQETMDPSQFFMFLQEGMDVLALLMGSGGPIPSRVFHFLILAYLLRWLPSIARFLGTYLTLLLSSLLFAWAVTKLDKQVDKLHNHSKHTVHFLKNFLIPILFSFFIYIFLTEGLSLYYLFVLREGAPLNPSRIWEGLFPSWDPDDPLRFVWECLTLSSWYYHLLFVYLILILITALFILVMRWVFKRF